MLEFVTKIKINKTPYFDRMSKYDLIARNTKSIEEYKKKYTSSIEFFNEKEKKHLSLLCNRINKKIKWKIAKINNEIEMGFPHTIYDTIILSKNFFTYTIKEQLKILIHEQIHVYQKLNTLETELKIQKNNYILFDRIENYELARNNPDINGNIYLHSNSSSKDKYILIQMYNSKNPKSLLDSTLYKIYITTSKIEKANINEYEHPLEEEAYVESEKKIIELFS